MKLTRLPGNEPTVKHSFAFKQSTANLLVKYQKAYSEMIDAEVSMKDVVEQMLLDFIGDDKAFQKKLRDVPVKEAAKPSPAPTPAAAPAVTPVIGSEVLQSTQSAWSKSSTDTN